MSYFLHFSFQSIVWEFEYIFCVQSIKIKLYASISLTKISRKTKQLNEMGACNITVLEPKSFYLLHNNFESINFVHASNFFAQ